MCFTVAMPEVWEKIAPNPVEDGPKNGNFAVCLGCLGPGGPSLGLEIVIWGKSYRTYP